MTFKNKLKVGLSIFLIFEIFIFGRIPFLSFICIFIFVLNFYQKILFVSFLSFASKYAAFEINWSIFRSRTYKEVRSSERFFFTDFEFPKKSLGLGPL